VLDGIGCCRFMKDSPVEDILDLVPKVLSCINPGLSATAGPETTLEEGPLY